MLLSHKRHKEGELWCPTVARLTLPGRHHPAGVRLVHVWNAHSHPTAVVPVGLIIRLFIKNIQSRKEVRWIHWYDCSEQTSRYYTEWWVCVTSCSSSAGQLWRCCRVLEARVPPIAKCCAEVPLNKTTKTHWFQWAGCWMELNVWMGRRH